MNGAAIGVSLINGPGAPVVAASTFVFDEGAKQLTSGGTVDWAADTIKVRLVDASVTPVITDTAMTGYTAIGTDQTLGSKTKTKDTTNNQIIFSGANTSSTPAASSTIGSVVVYKFDTDDAHSIPLFCLAVTPTVTDGNPLQISIPVTGLGYSQQ